MNANELKQIDFCNPDSTHYANSEHYIAQLEAMISQQQAEIERIRNIAESHIRSEYEGTSLLDGLLNDLYGKAQEK